MLLTLLSLNLKQSCFLLGLQQVEHFYQPVPVLCFVIGTLQSCVRLDLCSKQFLT